jgi:exonuclease III
MLFRLRSLETATVALLCNVEGSPERRPQDSARICRHVLEEEDPYFGDIPGPERLTHFRLGCLNVNRVSPYRDPSGERYYFDEVKHEEIFRVVEQQHLDVVLMQEVGVNWSRVLRENQWKAQAAVQLNPAHTRSYTSYNTHDVSGSAFQWGGTGIMSYGKISHYSAGAGSDKAKLGRWTWARYRGKNEIMLRCVTFYHPNNSFGALTVASQHRQYFQTQNDDRDPRVAFLEDFEVELQEWIDSGDHVIVGGDINKDVSHPDIGALFLRHGLHNVIFSHHDRINAPPTFSWGNRVIDGLWATAALDISACGYFAPGETTSDHSLLWMDVSYDSALGHTLPFPSTFQAR